MRRIMLLVVLTAVAALTASVATAAVSPSYQLSGFAAASQQGNTMSLAGQALGSNGDRAFWHASVTAGPLSSCATLNSSCDITGGTFVLAGRAGSITGTLSGSVTLTSQSQRGVDQYTVLATVATATGTAELKVVLTMSHGGFHGSCFGAGASVQGALTPAFTAPGG